MKNKYLPLLALLLLVFSCTKPDDILNDFQVHISPTFYKYVMEVNVEDLVDPETAIGTISINLTGPDAAAVYNIDGTRDYQVNSGTIQLMISRDAEPTIANPIDFVVVLEANGYQKTNVPMSIGVQDYFVSNLAQMLNLNTLPVSIGNTQINGGIDPATNTLTQPLIVTAGSPDSLSKITMTIPTDVKFLDADGNEIVAKRGGTGLNVNVLSLSDTSQTAQQAMPNGTGMVQTVSTDGVNDTILLEQTGSFNITMDVDGVPVRGFSGGKTNGAVGTRIPIAAGTENPETGNDYAEGDSVGMMSLSDGDDAWEVEDKSFVIKKDAVTGDLYAEASITHLSWWRWRWRRFWRPQVRNYGIGAFYSDPSGNGAGAVSGSILARYSWRHFSHWHSSYFRIGGNFGTNFIRNPKRVFRSWRVYSNPVIVASSFSSATYNLTQQNAVYRGYNMRLLKIEPKVTPPAIGYRLYCGSSNTLVSPPAGVKMYYRKTSVGGNFQHLYTFTQANQNVTFATFPQLEKNVRYDFQARFNDVTKDTLNVEVVDQRIYEVTLPNSACTALGL
jgi:hypothetical protein